MFRKLLFFTPLCAFFFLIGTMQTVTAEPLATFTVTSAVDAPDTNPGDGNCVALVTPPFGTACTLRAALEEANFLAATPDTIDFSAGMAGATLTLNSSLGGLQITGNSTTINGTANDKQTISGASLPVSSASLLRIGGNLNRVQNLIFRSAPLDAIHIRASLGQSADGNTLDALTIIGNTASGVRVFGVDGAIASGNIIRYSRVGALFGIITTCSNANRNNVGIILGENSTNSLILESYIVCNQTDGIYLEHTSLNTIQDNWIGVSAIAIPSLGNQGDGIEIYQSTSTLLTGNRIGWNLGDGVHLLEADSTTLHSNWIGTFTDGTKISNAGDGVDASDSDFLVIGGSSTDEFRNTISGNLGNGVFWSNVNQSELGPFDYAGGSSLGLSGLGNGSAGIRLVNSANNEINLPAVLDNGAAGVVVLGLSSVGNDIRLFKFSGNLGVPVDLDGEGATPNDSGDGDSGANTLINYPVQSSRIGNTVSGTVCPNCIVRVYAVYQGDTSGVNAIGEFLEGVQADGAGNWSYTHANLPPVLAFQARDPLTDNTSELSPAVVRKVFLPVILR
ncbi:MAG TPA: NosD domain-containing protein [Anaerolineales bacterium]|nr:NosD domain-containing protein [Anaerolineales bacterium]